MAGAEAASSSGRRVAPVSPRGALPQDAPLSVWAKVLLVPVNVYAVCLAGGIFKWFVHERCNMPGQPTELLFGFMDRCRLGPVAWLIGDADDLTASARDPSTQRAALVLALRFAFNMCLVFAFGFLHHFFARLSVRRALRRGVSVCGLRLRVHRQVVRTVFMCVTGAAWANVELWWQPLVYCLWDARGPLSRAPFALAPEWVMANVQYPLTLLWMVCVWWTVWMHSMSQFLGMHQLLYGFTETDADPDEDTDAVGTCALSPSRVSAPATHQPIPAGVTADACPALNGSNGSASPNGAAGHGAVPVLITTGLYGWVRHPMYFFLLAMAVAVPVLTLDRACWAAAAVVFLVVALPHEEVKLIQIFGQPYRDYQLTTPAFVPLWPMPGLKAQATAKPKADADGATAGTGADSAKRD